MAAAIAFQTLGPVSLTDAEGHEMPALLAQPRRLALVAYLAVATPRGLHRRDAILTLFWPELDQQHARAALRQALRVIRGSLGAVLTSRGDDEIGLDFEHFQCDADAFARAIAGGRWNEALELYRGELLEGFFIPGAPEFERWLDAERARLRAAVVGGARALVERATEVGDVAAAAQWAERGLRLAPLDEALMQRLIGILDRRGDRAGAVQAYEDFARRLALELEVQPSAETQALLAAVRERDVVAAPIDLSAPGPSLSLCKRRVPRRVVITLAGLPAAAVLIVLVGFNVGGWRGRLEHRGNAPVPPTGNFRSEEHTSELQSRLHLVCRLLLEKKKNRNSSTIVQSQASECSRANINDLPMHFEGCYEYRIDGFRGCVSYYCSYIVNDYRVYGCN